MPLTRSLQGHEAFVLFVFVGVGVVGGVGGVGVGVGVGVANKEQKLRKSWRNASHSVQTLTIPNRLN